MDTCNACGKCCKKHWLVKLTNRHEKELFKDILVAGEYIFTDECKFFVDNKCTIHGDLQPYKCKLFFCEGRDLDKDGI